MQYKKQLILILILNLFVFYAVNPAFIPIIIIEPSLVYFIIEKPISFHTPAFILLLTGQLFLIYQIIAKKDLQYFVNIGILSITIGSVFIYLSIREIEDVPSVPITTSIPFLIAVFYYFNKRYLLQRTEAR